MHVYQWKNVFSIKQFVRVLISLRRGLNSPFHPMLDSSQLFLIFCSRNLTKGLNIYHTELE